MYSLVWENHKRSLADTIRDLLNCELLLDCTLAAEGQTLKVHKIVLASCSPYFKLLFTEEQCANPVIILKDVRFHDLKLVIDFMYKGEAVVPSEQVHSFLETAKSLQVLNVQLPNDQNISSSTDVINRPCDMSKVCKGRNSCYHCHAHTNSQLQRIAIEDQQDHTDYQIDSIPNVKFPDVRDIKEEVVGNDSDMEQNLDNNQNCASTIQGLADGQCNCADQLKGQNASAQSLELQDSCSCSCAADGANNDDFKKIENEGNCTSNAFCSSNQGSELINGETDECTEETIGEVLETIKEESIEWEENLMSQDTGNNNLENETYKNMEVDESEEVTILHKSTKSSRSDNSISCCHVDNRDHSCKCIHGAQEDKTKHNMKPVDENCNAENNVMISSPSCVHCDALTRDNASFEKNNIEDDNLNNNSGEKECNTYSTGKSQHAYTVDKKKVCDSARATVIKNEENYFSSKSSKVGLKVRNQRNSRKSVSKSKQQERVLNKDGSCSSVTIINSDKENESSNCGKGDKSITSTDAVQCSTTLASILPTTDASIPRKLKKKRKIYPRAKIDRYCCKDCDRYFTYQSELRVHRRMHTGEKPFQCRYCDKSFSMQSTLTLHKRVHTGERPFKCKFCDKRYTGRSGLISHLRFHTGEKPFSCETCGRKFIQKTALNSHRLIHSGEKPFKCQVCSKRFTRFAVVKAHQLAHFGIRQFKCNVCGKEFSYKSALSDHERVHTGERPFKCDHCAKCYSTKRTLAAHVQSHFNTSFHKERYKCDHCTLVFGKVRALRVHLKCHKVKSFVCNHCGKKFTHKGRFSMHMLTHERDKTSESMNCEGKDS